MTDPGEPLYSGATSTETGISGVVITHEHADHLHIDSLKVILTNNPDAIVITNASVGRLLTEAGIAFTLVEEGESTEVSGIRIYGFGNTHAEIYNEYGQVQNTGYMIDTLCYPGDAFHYPDREVDILALPVTAPWLTIKEAIDYAKNIQPRIVFPVHDGFIKEFFIAPYKLSEQVLNEANISFKKLEIGKEEEL